MLITFFSDPLEQHELFWGFRGVTFRDADEDACGNGPGSRVLLSTDLRIHLLS